MYWICLALGKEGQEDTIFDIGMPIPAICIPIFMNPEISGKQENPGNQDDRCKSEKHIKRSQYMHKLRIPAFKKPRLLPGGG
jgi:hypothetical protein